MSAAEEWKRGHQEHNADRTARILSATKCLRVVRGFMNFDSVIDFGCGIGAWLEAAHTLGATRLVGIEGEWIRNTDTLIDKDLIRIADLATMPPFFAKDFDLAISIEVAEHLPETCADNFVNAITSSSSRVLFSAAIPKQGGIGHVNEQPLLYWVEKFWARRYVPLEPIRPFIQNEKAIYPWLRQNIVMFVHFDELVRCPELMRFARPIADFRLHYRPL